MKKNLTVLLLIFLCYNGSVYAQEKIDSLLPVRGFCIGAPKPKDVGAFTKFIVEELAPRHVNTLILRVDYRYEFKSHPELADSFALSKSDVKEMVNACKTVSYTHLRAHE